MDPQRIEAIDAYFRAANFLSLGQIYLKENGLLREPLKKEHIKPRLLGHFGTTPGLNFIYAHLNRLIQDTRQKMLFIAGPGHGGPGMLANTFLEGTLGNVYPQYSHDIKGVNNLVKHFSWPRGFSSHVGPHVPGSIHEGGELGYSLMHAFGAVYDNKDLMAVCVIGDGEAETGPLACSLQSNKFINRKRDGAVLPILHLNGYKISGPTLLGRTSDINIAKFYEGLGYTPIFAEGDDPMKMHAIFAKVLDEAYALIVSGGSPFIILRTPKGWTCPKFVDGKQIEGTFRAHQIPINHVIENEAHLNILEAWATSYKPDELFTKKGAPSDLILSLNPKKKLQMGRSPHANGGLLLKELHLPSFEKYQIDVTRPGKELSEATKIAGEFLRDVFKKNRDNFRIFCPDETDSNRLSSVFEVTNRMYQGEVLASDDHLANDGLVMEVLSEHLCQGWLEGYLLTGRHGLFPCYEAFALIVDSMLNQHGKWLKLQNEISWRAPIASLNYLLTSHAWRQDHNGYSHQGPGFIESVLQKKDRIARIYLPPDTNTLLCTLNHVLKSKGYINLIIIGKQPLQTWLSMKEAKKHCEKGLSIWPFASNDEGNPDIVMVASGDVPTLETLAAISLLRKADPTIKIRMINVLDLFALSSNHSHSLSEDEFTHLFTEDKPIIFAFHGHPRVIHELIYKRPHPERFHVRGYIEEGSTTTPFDMTVQNKLSRFDLAILVLNRLSYPNKALLKKYEAMLQKHAEYIVENGDDLEEIKNWEWDL